MQSVAPFLSCLFPDLPGTYRNDSYLRLQSPVGLAIHMCQVCGLCPEIGLTFNLAGDTPAICLRAEADSVGRNRLCGVDSIGG